MSKTKNNPIVAFLDNIGRIIIGKAVNETTEILSIENPALVHIQPSPQTNQLQLQLLPLFFREFQDDKEQPTIWDFKQANVTKAKNVTFNPQFLAQYEQAFGSVPKAPTSNEPEVVKLFDEEDGDKK